MACVGIIGGMAASIFGVSTAIATAEPISLVPYAAVDDSAGQDLSGAGDSGPASSGSAFSGPGISGSSTSGSSASFDTGPQDSEDGSGSAEYAAAGILGRVIRGVVTGS